MRKIGIVARREYLAAVRTKAFLIGLLSMPLMMFGGIGMQMLLKDQVDVGDKHFAVIDRTPGGKVGRVLEAAARLRNNGQVRDPRTGLQVAPRFLIATVAPSMPSPEAMAAQRLDLSDRVRSKLLDGVLEIGPDALKPPTGPPPPLDARGRPARPPDDRIAIRYQTDRPLDDAFPHWAELTVNAAAMQERASANRVSLKALTETLTPVPLVRKRLSVRSGSDDPEGVADPDAEGRAASFLAPAGLAILMLMMILVSTTPLMQGVLEEKNNRIAEVLLGSVRPTELMAGKLLGMVAVSLTTASIYLAGGYWAAHRYGFAEYLPGPLVAWFLFYQVIGVLMYGSLFIAIGAACSDVKETQSLLTPVMLVAMTPMFILVNLIERPSGPLATGLSFFPFATPMVMIVRQSIPPGVPWWQPAVGILGSLATTAACVFAAGRVLRVGLLMQGKGANLARMARWIVRG